MTTTTADKAAVERIRQHSEGVQMVRVVAIGPNPHEPRKTIKEESVWELALHIGNNGLHQPIMVRPASDGHAEIEYERAFGQRRHLAFMMLDCCDWTIDGERLPWADAYEIDGITHIPCVVRTMTDADLIKLSLSENAMREDVSWLDETKAIAAALAADVGLKQADIASMVGASNSQVSNRLRLLRLSDRLLMLVDRGHLPWTIARKILVLTPKSHRHSKEIEVVADYLEDKITEREGRGKETVILDKWDVDVAIKRVLDTKGVHRSWESLTPDYDFWLGHNLRKEGPLFDLEAFKKEYPQSIHKLPVKAYSYQSNEQKVTLWTCEGKIWRQWQAEAKERIKRELEAAAPSAPESEYEEEERDPYWFVTRDKEGYIMRSDYLRVNGRMMHVYKEFKPDEGETEDDALVVLTEGVNCRIWTDSGAHWHAEWQSEDNHRKGSTGVYLTECFETREEAEAYLHERKPECGWVTKHESEQVMGPVVTIEDRARRVKEERAAAEAAQVDTAAD